jgi:aerobic carbon-monoxide dehydrogenase small subunit
MKSITLEVNGVHRSAMVHPRTSLADLLREEFRLTGTHLGCEQGVCGACTINLNGRPVRSCLAFAVGCEDAAVATIEHFDDDETIAELRQAFATEHALQCGYCTPGMLITARDIVLRLPRADEARIRVELSGNLCRCTGYIGIVRAIRHVLAARAASVPPPDPVSDVGVPAIAPAESARPETAKPIAPPPFAPPPLRPHLNHAPNRLTHRLLIHQPRAKVWLALQDFERVVAYIPGAKLLGPVDGGNVRGAIAVKLGPISADFSGTANIVFDHTTYSGVVTGSGIDRGNGSYAAARMSYQLDEVDGGDGTEVAVAIDYSFSGYLAQFGRSGIVKALMGRIVQTFAANMERDFDAEAGRVIGGGDTTTARLDIVSIVLGYVCDRLGSLATWHRRSDG